MALFAISYDLIKHKDYPKLWDALKRQGAHRVLNSVWLIDINSTSKGVCDWLSQYIDADDKIIVIPMRGHPFWNGNNAMAGTNNWLKAHA